MKTLATTAALCLALVLPGAAQARDGFSPGAAAALGAIGGVALGAAIAAPRDEGYYPGRRIYAAPPPEPEVVVVRPRRRVVVEEIVPACHFERRRYENEYGDVTIRRVRVCG